MKKVIYSTTFLFLISINTESFSQSKYSTINANKINDCLAKLYQNCTEVVSNSQSSYPNSAEDTALVNILNFIFNNSGVRYSTIKDFIIKKNGKIISERTTGLMSFYVYSFPRARGLLKVYIMLGVISDFIGRINYEVTTNSYPICKTTGSRIENIDYVYLNTYLANIFEFPMFFYPGAETITFDSIFHFEGVNNITPRYLYSSPNLKTKQDSSVFYNMIWVTDYFYSLQNPVNNIKHFIRSSNYLALEDLLFSPNHTVALNAMETLEYLKLTNKYNMTPKSEYQIKIIKRRKIKGYRYSRSHVKRYSDLIISKEDLLKKFKDSI